MIQIFLFCVTNEPGCHRIRRSKIFWFLHFLEEKILFFPPGGGKFLRICLLYAKEKSVSLQNFKKIVSDSWRKSNQRQLKSIHFAVRVVVEIAEVGKIFTLDQRFLKDSMQSEMHFHFKYLIADVTRAVWILDASAFTFLIVCGHGIAQIRARIVINDIGQIRARIVINDHSIRNSIVKS